MPEIQHTIVETLDSYRFEEVKWPEFRSVMPYTFIQLLDRKAGAIVSNFGSDSHSSDLKQLLESRGIPYDTQDSFPVLVGEKYEVLGMGHLIYASEDGKTICKFINGSGTYSKLDPVRGGKLNKSCFERLKKMYDSEERAIRKV